MKNIIFLLFLVSLVSTLNATTIFFQNPLAQVGLQDGIGDEADIIINHSWALNFASSGQIPNFTSVEPSWSDFINGEGKDYGAGVAIDNRGYVYVTGYSNSCSRGGYDVFLVKYNSKGTKIWNITWGGSANDYGYDVAIDKEGYVYVTGKTSSFGAGSSDMFLIKVSENGNIVWNITFGGQQADEGRGIVVDSQDNIYVTGSKYDNTSGDFDIFLTKYDKNGTIIWNREWGGSFRDKGYGIAIDQADYIYITGVTYIYETNEHRMVLIKYNGDGDVIWTVTWKGRYKEYEGMGYVFLDYGYDIAIDDDGFIYVVGTSYVSGADYQNRRLFVLKYDNRGNLLWELARKICFWDFGLGIAVDKQGTIYVVGASLSVQTVRVNVIMLGINNDGKLIWNLTWTNNVEATNLGLGVAVSQNNTVFITGYTGIYIDLPYYVELIMNGPTSAFVISFNNGDSDHDGLSYLWEKCVQTNPERNDTDGDGMPDGWEVNHGLKPTVNDATQDADGDGITNYEEYIRGTNPADTDSDEDFLPDNFDFIAGPLDSVIIFGVICVIVILSAFTVNRYTTKRRK